MFPFRSISNITDTPRSMSTGRLKWKSGSARFMSDNSHPCMSTSCSGIGPVIVSVTNEEIVLQYDEDLALKNTDVFPMTGCTC